ncbi:acetyl esterase/lipase [Motilibacter peucedani]|uniref:Acetyl esterase/lipase n=1 Tax=Motilibacter peucedani TaxID=598650 RepID=A0A420XQK1_9ACTN|nr:alpha/beta hydrolase [Motilibacter peucedani]RKS75539.1 acetyl esterase/lipase [Motilibacter peucedani]
MPAAQHLGGRMDAELSAALIMFDIGDGTDLEDGRERLHAIHRTSSLTVPHAVEVRDIAPGPDGPPVRVRFYRPRGAADVPVMLWLHGGAFAFGFAEIDDELCVRLAEDSGFAIASPDYRLSPEHPFPAAFDDGYGTLEWVLRNAGPLGLDTGCVAVGGSSAGGALAAGVCLRARDEGGPEIHQQLLICPVTDDRMATRSMQLYTHSPCFTRQGAELMWDRYLGPSRDEPPRYAAPAREEDLSGLPPAFVLTAEEDPLRDEGIDYALRLIAAGTSTELHHVPGTFHSFDSIVPTAGVSQRAYADYLAALQRCRTR